MNRNKLKQVEIFTDGGSLGNPGPGGYGIVIKYRDKVKEITGGYNLTTNNRMELTAAIIALTMLKEKCGVKLYTDSKYVVDGIMKGWAKSWQKKGWMRNKKDKAINPDLWQKLLDLTEYHDVEFIWVKGHAGHPENERCDKLSKQSAAEDNLPVDEGYMNNGTDKLSLL